MSRQDRRQDIRPDCYLLFRPLFEFPGEDTYQLLEEGRHISLWKNFFGENNDSFHNIFSEELPRHQRLKNKWREQISVFYKDMISILEEFISEEWRLLKLDQSNAEKFKKFAG